MILFYTFPTPLCDEMKVFYDFFANSQIFYIVVKLFEIFVQFFQKQKL